MEDIFRSGGGLRNQRSFRGRKSWNIPASLGVRLGFVADLERPLPDGVPSQRRWCRIPAAIRVLVGAEWHRVTGDVSAGGALLLFPHKIAQPRLEMIIQLRDGRGTWIVTGDVVRCQLRGWRYAHHVRFVAPALFGLDVAIEDTLRAGGRTLETA
ncbi:MAG TPA: PilZ domain-containing protein [Myxococcaceae bacterium]|nr:PilZ domain-containing protein [Myxococcaceae bacterium]